jgi:hypothetical protein
MAIASVQTEARRGGNHENQAVDIFAGGFKEEGGLESRKKAFLAPLQ